MSKFKTTKGITLITLVITIVILLILAAIAIQSVINSGLLNRANTAKDKQNEANALQEMSEIVAEVQIDELGKATLKDVVEKLRDIKDKTYIVKTTSSSIIASLDPTGISALEDLPDDLDAIYVTNIEYGCEIRITKMLEISAVDKNSQYREGRHNVTISTEDANKGVVSKSGIVLDDENFPIFAICKSGYAFDHWEITKGEDKCTIEDSTNIRTVVNNVKDEIEIVAKFKATNLSLATADQITKGYYSYDNEGNAVLGNYTSSVQKPLKCVHGSLAAKGYYEKNYSGDFGNISTFTTMTSSFKQWSRLYMNFSETWDTGLTQVVAYGCELNGFFWTVYNGDTMGYAARLTNMKVASGNDKFVYSSSNTNVSSKMFSSAYDRGSPTGDNDYWISLRINEYINSSTGSLKLSTDVLFDNSQASMSNLTYNMAYKSYLFGGPEFWAIGYE